MVSCVLAYLDLLFHLDGLTTPNEVWENIVEIFGKTYEMRGHQIENELISLSPKSFKSLQLYFSKFKALFLVKTMWDRKEGRETSFGHTL